jgi:hypothetical protein
MIARHAHQRDIPLDSKALGICQCALDAALTELNITREHEDAETLASLIIKFYQQGIHDQEKLFHLAMAASEHLNA